MSRSHAFRLPQGGRVDRARTVSFTFNGRRLSGVAGDTLASALLANGVGVVARSFKLHRPRGILAAGFEEPNALVRVEIDGSAVPLVRATLQPLVEGMSVSSENCFPSVDFDVGRVLDFLHPLFPAGFYNKTFKWPGWHTYEPFVRRMAGLGTLPTGADRTSYHRHHLHCDVLVIGGGAAGLAAARAASRAGAQVVLMEQDGELGGRLLAERAQVEGQPARAWIEAAVDELKRAPLVRIMCRTLVAGYYDHNVLTAIDRSDAEQAGAAVERFWIIRARQVVLAAGAIEQPLVCANNDRPGILLAGAVRTYLNRYGVAVGRNVVVATNNDDAYRTAFDLHDAGQDSGVRVAAIVDARSAPGPRVEEQAKRRQLAIHRASMLVDTRGSPSVSAAAVMKLGSDGRSLEGKRTWIACDAIAMSSGWSPTVHLYSQAGGTVSYSSALACFVPDDCRQRVRAVGAANGEFALAAVIAGGARAGAEAARAARLESSPLPRASAAERGETFGILPVRRAPGGPESRQWVDFQHDVTTADIRLALQENYRSVEHLKRYTTAGMAVDQGKTSNLSALTLLAEMSGRGIPAVGTTTFRPQFMPVTFGAISGGAQDDLYAPSRHMPAHACHVRRGAQFEDYGGWQRPACYTRSGENRASAIPREVRTVRNALGLFEGSPLGKIELRGRDAAQFLHRIYFNNVLSLQPGKVRYGVMLNENGTVLDDGVVACLAPDHFLVSTTAAGAERIAAWLDEWHQCEWPELDLIIMPVTTQWAVLTLAGARARTLLQTLSTDIDFSAPALPHMNFRAGHLSGRAVRIQRVSFSGELSYEISVAATEAESAWEEIMQRGEAFGIGTVGVEAWLVLRLEKGFLHVGSDTDGVTNPLDLGLGAILDKKSGDFVGRRSLLRAHDRSSERRQLIGLEPLDPQAALVTGAHIVRSSAARLHSEGFVTSAAWSPTLGRSIGLALLDRGHGRIDERVTVFDEGRCVEARVLRPPFFDPRGERMNA